MDGSSDLSTATDLVQTCVVKIPSTTPSTAAPVAATPDTTASAVAAPGPATRTPGAATEPSAKLPWRTEVLLLIMLALLLRMAKIVATEPWLDEACSIELARHGPAALLHTLATSDASPHPPLYFLLLSGVIGLLGDAAGPARLLSLFAGLGLVAGTAEAARRVAGRWPARVAGLIAAVSPLAIHYSVEARGYGLLAVLCLGLALTTQRFVARGGRRSAVLLTVLGLAAGLTHYFALFLIPLPLLVSLPSRDGSQPTGSASVRATWVRGRQATGLLALAMAPALWLVLGQLARGAGGTSWLRPMPSIWDAARGSLVAMAIGTQLPGYLGHAGLVRVGELLHALGLGFMGAGAVLGALWPLAPKHRGPRRALLALALLAAGAPLLLSIWRPLYLPGRYELAAMAPVHALAAVGWWQVLVLLSGGSARRKRLTGGLLCLVVLGLSAGYLPRYLSLNTVQPFTFLTGSIVRPNSRGHGAKTAVIVTRLTGPPMQWQLRQAEFAGVTRYFPAAQGRHPCWVDRREQHDPALPAEAKTLAQELRRAGMTRLIVIVALRDRRTLVPAGLLLGTLKRNGWKMRGSRHMGAYGIVIFGPAG